VVDLLSWICRRHVACRDIIVDFGVDSQSTATFCCAWHVIRCQCKKCVSNMSIVIDIDLWADIKWCQCKNVSDVSRRVTCVSGVCRLWGDLPTDRKTTYPAKSTCSLHPLHFSLSSDTLVIAGKTHELSEYNFGYYDMGYCIGFNGNYV
jgi:hypothetical protein